MTDCIVQEPRAATLLSRASEHHSERPTSFVEAMICIYHEGGGGRVGLGARLRRAAVDHGSEAVSIARVRAQCVPGLCHESGLGWFPLGLRRAWEPADEGFVRNPQH